MCISTVFEGVSGGIDRYPENYAFLFIIVNVSFEKMEQMKAYRFLINRLDKLEVFFLLFFG